MDDKKKVRVLVKDSINMDGCRDGQERHGKGNRNDEC